MNKAWHASDNVAKVRKPDSPRCQHFPRCRHKSVLRSRFQASDDALPHEMEPRLGTHGMSGVTPCRTCEPDEPMQTRSWGHDCVMRRYAWKPNDGLGAPLRILPVLLTYVTAIVFKEFCVGVELSIARLTKPFFSPLDLLKRTCWERQG